MSFIRGSSASAPLVNGLDANAYINSLPNVASRAHAKRPPMGSTNLMHKSVDSALTVSGGSKPVTSKPTPPANAKIAALPTTHWTQLNASAGGTRPSARTVSSVRGRSVDSSQSRVQAAAPVAAVALPLTLTASHMSPIKQSLKGYHAEIARAKPETSKETVEEMQRKAKGRAEAWRRQLLADANSVRNPCCPRVSALPRFTQRSLLLTHCRQAEAQREAARKQKEQVAVCTVARCCSRRCVAQCDRRQERLDAEKAAGMYRARMCVCA